MKNLENVGKCRAGSKMKKNILGIFFTNQQIFFEISIFPEVFFIFETTLHFSIFSDFFIIIQLFFIFLAVLQYFGYVIDEDKIHPKMTMILVQNQSDLNDLTSKIIVI